MTYLQSKSLNIASNKSYKPTWCIVGRSPGSCDPSLNSARGSGQGFFVEIVTLSLQIRELSAKIGSSLLLLCAGYRMP